MSQWEEISKEARRLDVGRYYATARLQHREHDWWCFEIRERANQWTYDCPDGDRTVSHGDFLSSLDAAMEAAEVALVELAL